MRLLPNVLTVIRVLLTPFIAYTLLRGRCDIALPVSLVAGLTDAADGYMARRFAAESRLGAWLDPLADKFLLTSVYVSFGLVKLVPNWLVWIVVGRDLMILGMAGAGLAFTTIRDFPPSIWGKVSTIIQIGAAVVVLAGCAGATAANEVKPLAIGLTAVATGWSGLHYAWRALNLLRGLQQKV